MTLSSLARTMFAALGCTVAAAASAAQPGVKTEGAHAVMSLPSVLPLAAGDPVDYIHAQPHALPIASNFSHEIAQADMIGALASASVSIGNAPGFVRGSAGDGTLSPQFLGTPALLRNDAMADGGMIPQEAGSSSLPFSTARADAYSGATNQTYPFRAAGKLFFTDNGGSYVCSASLIGRGLVVTAAHCVTNFGKKLFYTNFRFVPGYRSGSAPYGNWSAKEVRVLSAYFNGTDTCSQKGVVCTNDVAVMALNDQSGKYPGTSTGWYGYAYDGAGFTSNGLTHVTQIGYPVCLDNGQIMERNDSQGFKSASYANNTLIGSLMCGGSSGGPWILNFGKRPTLTDTSSGSAATTNAVIGVTSWGSSSAGPKEQGAAPFLSTNIRSLVSAICAANAAACAN